MKSSTQIPYNEQRWPVVLSILIVLAMLVQFPQRIRLFPPLILALIVVIELIPLIAVMLAPQRTTWHTVERIATFIFSIGACMLCVANLAMIVGAMLKRSEDISGLQLLLSGLGVWTINVLAFSILYWIIDRGGPSRRSNNTSPRPDWLFPQEGAPPEDYPAGWRPDYIDYLFLGYCTSAAFSPTDALPLTHRAKLLMMLQSSISLATILVVLSRAINILA